MQSAPKLRQDYSFTEEDERNLVTLGPVMETEKLRVGDELHRYITSIPEISHILAGSDEIRKRHRAALGKWFSDLFRGRYDRSYFANLQRVGETHVRIGLSGHFVNSAMNMLRGLCHRIIREKIDDADEQNVHIASLDKILDMNLDILTSSYREAELRKVFLSDRLDESLLRFAERFSFALKLILVLALMGISFAVVGLFVGDVITLFKEKNAHGVLAALGSLLIIWVMV